VRVGGRRGERIKGTASLFCSDHVFQRERKGEVSPGRKNVRLRGLANLSAGGEKGMITKSRRTVRLLRGNHQMCLGKIKSSRDVGESHKREIHLHTWSGG